MYVLKNDASKKFAKKDCNKYEYTCQSLHTVLQLKYSLKLLKIKYKINLLSIIPEVLFMQCMGSVH